MDSRIEGRDEPAGQARARAPDEPCRLLFLCTGNTCRSPMASGRAQQLLDSWGWSGIEVRSAGVATFPGSPASGGALRAAEVYGVDLTSHESVQLTEAVVRWADLILAMSEGHVRTVAELGGTGKAELITRFAATGAGEGEGGDSGVLDPVGGDDALYRETFEQLSDLVVRSLIRLGANEPG